MACHRCCCRSSGFAPSCFIFLCSSACYPALYWSERDIPWGLKRTLEVDYTLAHQYSLAVVWPHPYNTNTLLGKFVSWQFSYAYLEGSRETDQGALSSFWRKSQWTGEKSLEGRLQWHRAVVAIDRNVELHAKGQTFLNPWASSSPRLRSCNTICNAFELVQYEWSLRDNTWY